MIIRYLGELKNLFFKNTMMPKFIVLYLTDACNLACRHCFYYNSLNKSSMISYKNLETLSNSIHNIINISFTGGEPFTRKDLPAIIRLFYKNSGMRIASIVTNGTLQKKIIEDITNICSENPQLTVNLSVSLDGLKETHDYIRVKKGTFDISIKTLKLLCDMKLNYKNLHVGIICTIHEANDNEIIPLFDKINKEMNINQFQINFVRGKTKELKPSSSTVTKYIQANAYIQDKLLKNKYKGYDFLLKGLYNSITQRQKKLIVETLKENKHITPCYAGTTNCIILPNGTVHACEMRNDVNMGNLNEFDWDLSKLIRSNQAKIIRKKIIKSNCFCTFECQASSNIAYNPTQFALSVFDLIKMKHGMMNNHFKKYLGD